MRLRKPKSLRWRNVIGAISLLMCVGVITCARKHGSQIGFRLERESTMGVVTARGSRLEVGYLYSMWRIEWTPIRRPTNSKSQFFFRPTNVQQFDWEVTRAFYDTSGIPKQWNFLGCVLVVNEYGAEANARFGFRLAFPSWLLIILTLLLPLRLAISLIRRTKNPHACPTCGYDLRATPDRCPECGSSVDRPKEAAAEAADRVA